MTAAGSHQRDVPVRVFGGPTALIEYGGLRLLTDPTFDAPGGDYPEVPVWPRPPRRRSHPPNSAASTWFCCRTTSTRTTSTTPAGPCSPTYRVILTTPSGAGRLGGTARGLADWESTELDRPGGGTITVTGVPALHGPDDVDGTRIGGRRGRRLRPDRRRPADGLCQRRQRLARPGAGDRRPVRPGGHCRPVRRRRAAPSPRPRSCSCSTARRPPRPPRSWAPARSSPSTTTAGPTSPRDAATWWTPSPPPD